MDQKEYLSSIFGLNGKTILITGASGGIGSAISKGVAQAGAEVALCGHTLSKCQDLSREIREMGGRLSSGCSRYGQHPEVCIRGHPALRKD